MPEIESALEAFGLPQKEVKVYVALLELGEATVLRLAGLTAINRTTLYDILESLLKKGIVGTSVKEKVKYFYPAKPEVLIDITKKKQQAIESVLPLLKEKMGLVGARPKVQFYEGAKGIDAVHQDVLSAKSIQAYGSFAIINKAAKYQSLDFRKKRLKLKIPMTAITDESAGEIELLNWPEYRKITKLYFDSSLSKIPSWTYIYENKVATLLVEKEQFFCFIAESPSLFVKESFLFSRLLQQAKSIDRQGQNGNKEHL